MLDFEKVKRLRIEKGLTQEQAARAAGMINRQQWNRLEAGRAGSVKLDSLARIAAALDVDPRELLTPPAPRRQKGKP